MNELNIADKRLNDQAGQEIIARYEQGRRVFIPKAGEFFELPAGGDARMISFVRSMGVGY